MNQYSEIDTQFVKTRNSKDCDGQEIEIHLSHDFVIALLAGYYNSRTGEDSKLRTPEDFELALNLSICFLQKSEEPYDLMPNDELQLIIKWCKMSIKTLEEDGDLSDDVEKEIAMFRDVQQSLEEWLRSYDDHYVTNNFVYDSF